LHWHGRTDWDSRLCAACYGYGNKAAPRPAPPPFSFRRRCGRRRGEERCGACGSPARHSRRRSRRGSPRAASPRPRRPPCWRAAHSLARGRVRAAARAPPPSSVLAPSTRPLSTLQFRLGASPVCDACPGHEHEEGGGVMLADMHWWFSGSVRRAGGAVRGGEVCRLGGDRTRGRRRRLPLRARARHRWRHEARRRGGGAGAPVRRRYARARSAAPLRPAPPCARGWPHTAKRSSSAGLASHPPCVVLAGATVLAGALRRAVAPPTHFTHFTPFTPFTPACS
jgi:hypothetical protein